ncbi:protocatechuate 3,4-dioxygenase subunit alpha [Microbacterium marinilacus]|uniref:Protocatechuate 3,4-dioxygenase subunit alpha n=1 Tax=Microbacterium marinilacus TaxID=415209 RepID=A0ABP7BXN0_9MICO|nr:protocatechuate 3,4-dioxygenase subunit alpha [Microbacterium marinilacus]MBY0688134.1 protocatechuate 3,4-dioxygenase subunit alpha [Microbacterium marinilacus]
MSRERILEPTAGQTIGPFFKFGLEYDRMSEVAFPHSPGAIVLSGTVYDGAGAPIPDSVVEIFGADSDGTVPTARGSLHRDGHTFTGFGRTMTTDDGVYHFWTRDPGPVEGPDGRTGAPFIAAVIYARGLPDKLHTRIYLPEHEDLRAADPFLSGLTEEERASLIATRTPEGYLRHDIHLQGDKETAFIAFR